MGKVRIYKNHITRFLTSDNGQRFFNFAYSIGAAIVIWGALFKILHLPGGNVLLSLGMGTEVLMFILSAFDRPPREYHWEDVFPELDKEDVSESAEAVRNADNRLITATAIKMKGETIDGGTVAAIGRVAEIAQTAETDMSQSATDVAMATRQYLDQLNSLTAEMSRLQKTTTALNDVSDVLLQSYKAITDNSENITNSSKGYVEQMESLNMNIGGLNTIYEIQLKSVSSQLDSIERVNRGIKDIRDMYEKSSRQSAQYMEETEKMARYMQQLNSVYEKMLTAMTINMYRSPIQDVNDNK